MNLVFFGILGSGKGTQAELLSKKMKIPIISTGNCFRKNIQNKTELGKKVARILSRGHLVNDEITFEMLKKELKRIDISKGFILDGYPRTIRQAKLLESFLPIDAVVNIALSEHQVMERITERRTCKCGATYHLKYNPPKKSGICDKCGEKLFVRSDSKESSVKNRIKVYKKKTEPLIEFYKKRDILLNINGNLPIKDVFKEILKKLKKLQNDINKK